MGEVDPHHYAVDAEPYRRGPHSWVDELDRVARPGPPHHRMGTRAIDEASWLPTDGHRVAELALRARLVAEQPDQVLAALPSSGAAAEEAAALVADWSGRHRPAPATTATTVLAPEPHPPTGLVAAGLVIQEDLCLMERVDDRWVLTAGMVCFPTYWRLADKIGRPQDEVHRPVHHFQRELADRVDRFFDRLAPGRIVARRNWGLTPHPLLFLPDPAVLEPTGPVGPDRLWIRSERQTLRRLPTSGAVLFTIRVQLAPLPALGRRPALAGRLLAAIESWSPELRAERGGSGTWMPGAVDWLAEVSRRRPEQGPAGRPVPTPPAGR